MCQRDQGHILRDHIVWYQGIAPGFATVACCVRGSVCAPFDRRVALRKHDRVIHLIAGLWFEHILRIRRFGDKVRLILQVIAALPVEDLELPFGRLEPFDGVAFRMTASLRSASESNFWTEYRHLAKPSKRYFAMLLLSEGETLYEIGASRTACVYALGLSSVKPLLIFTS